MSESIYYHISKKGKLMRMASAHDALNEAEADGFAWLCFCRPLPEEMDAIALKVGLHPLAVEDCFDDEQIPKLEEFPDNTYILFNAIRYANKELTIDEVNLFIGEKFIITVSRRGPEEDVLFPNIEQKIERNIENIRNGTAYLMHVLMDAIVDQKFIAIESLENELDATEDRMLEDIAAFNPAELQHLRRDLLKLRKCLFHEREILIKICRKDCRFIPEKAIFHYRDIYDHLVKFFELTETYRDILTSLMEMNLSMLNIEMAKSANKTNMTVRRLTFITTIFMPLTLLAGIGGMSEWTMITGSENWFISYPIFISAMVALGVISYYLLKRFEKRDIKKSNSE